MAENFMLYDEEFLENSGEIQSFSNQVEEKLKAYADLLDALVNEGIISDILAGNLHMLAENIRGNLIGKLPEIAEPTSRQQKQYIEAIDIADDFLY